MKGAKVIATIHSHPSKQDFFSGTDKTSPADRAVRDVGVLPGYRSMNPNFTDAYLVTRNGKVLKATLDAMNTQTSIFKTTW